MTDGAGSGPPSGAWHRMLVRASTMTALEFARIVLLIAIVAAGLFMWRLVMTFDPVIIPPAEPLLS